MSLSHRIAYQMLMNSKKVYDPANPPDYLANQRREAAAKPRAIPHDANCRYITLGGVAGEEISCRGNPAGQIVLYMHGGGFVGGTAKSRRDITLYTARRLGYNVVSIDYRLAPSHPFPAAPQDCFTAYRALEGQYGGANIALMGESAGGNLVLSVVLQARDAGVPPPACVVSISPVVQFDEVFPSHTENLHTDCMIDHLSREVIDAYLQPNKTDTLKNPYASPLLGALTGFPPTLLIASESEVLRDDAIKFHEKLLAAGSESQLCLYPGLMHAFAIITAFPESRKALNEAKKHLDLYLQQTEKRF